MKTHFIVFAASLLLSGSVFAKGGGSHSGSSHSSSGSSHSTKGYVKKDGTYVAPAHATNPNKSKSDNWSSKGNTNPHTGKKGTKDPDTGK